MSENPEADVPAGLSEDEIQIDETMYQAPEFSDLDWHQFRRLIAQESHTVEGQKAMGELLKTMISERLEARQRRITSELQSEGVPSDQLQPLVQRRMLDVATYYHIILDDGRENLIVEIGRPLHVHWKEQDDRDAICEKEVTVGNIAHYDIVEPITEDQLTLTEDPNNQDHVLGRGVWDMKGSVLNLLWYIEHLEVPPGMRQYLIFTADEEYQSKGAQALIERWRRFPSLDIIYTHEAAPEPVPVQDVKGHERMGTHTARRGRLKKRFQGKVNAAYIDHGAGRVTGNMTEVVAQFATALNKEFPRKKGQPTIPKRVMHGKTLQKNHHRLGTDDLEWDEVHTRKTRKGYTTVDEGYIDFQVALVPPNTCAEITDAIYELLVDVAGAKKGNWDALGIEWDLLDQPRETSYNPYETGAAGDPIIDIVRAIQEGVTGLVPEQLGASSVADECVYAQAINRDQREWRVVLSSAGLGGNAHGPIEWMSIQSQRNQRSVFMNLMMHEKGFQKFIDQETAQRVSEHTTLLLEP